jgi:outer membrane protein assembly factor BamB
MTKYARPWGPAAASAALALGLVGCWPAPGQGPDRASHNPFEQVITVDSVADLGELWSVDLGDGGVGAPIVSGGGVHATLGSVLHTRAPADGAARWTFDGTQPAPTFMSDPVHREGEVLVGYGFGNLGGNWQRRALDARTGEVLRDLGGGLVDGVRGSRVAGSTFSFGSLTPIAVGISLNDLGSTTSGWSGFVDVRDFSAAGLRLPATVGSDGMYHAGSGLLQTTPADQPAIGQGVRRFGNARPAQCYTGGEFPYFPCPQWATPIGAVVTTPVVVGPGEETVYVGTGDGRVVALDAATGAVQWTAAVGAEVTAAPALAGGTLYVPTADGDLVAVAADGCGAATCQALWKAPTGSRITVQPASAGGVVFTGSQDGTVRAFDADGCGAATCTELWSDATGANGISGAPAVTGGRLYVGTGAGELVAYGIPAG